MSDIFEVLIQENPLELVFTDSPLEVLIQEDLLEILVQDTQTEIIISNDEVEILTIAEQGPSGILGVAIQSNAPVNPVIGALWLDLN